MILEVFRFSHVTIYCKEKPEFNVNHSIDPTKRTTSKRKSFSRSSIGASNSIKYVRLASQITHRCVSIRFLSPLYQNLFPVCSLQYFHFHLSLLLLDGAGISWSILVNWRGYLVFLLRRSLLLLNSTVFRALATAEENTPDEHNEMAHDHTNDAGCDPDDDANHDRDDDMEDDAA